MTQIKSFKELEIEIPQSEGLEGPKIDIIKLFGRQIIVHRAVIKPTKYPEPGKNPDCLWMEISVDGNKRVVFSGSIYLQKQIREIEKKNGFPVSTTIVKKDNDSHQFT